MATQHHNNYHTFDHDQVCGSGRLRGVDMQKHWQINNIISYFGAGASPQKEFVEKYGFNFKKMSECNEEDLMAKVDEEDVQIDGEGDEEDNEEMTKAKEGKPIQAKETIAL